MSAYNTVTCKITCPITAAEVQLIAQFKYGKNWQIQYHIGEQLHWGGNDIGERGKKNVVVDAISEKCPACGIEHDLDLFLCEDKIVSVKLHDERNNFNLRGKNYIILEE